MLNTTKTRPKLWVDKLAMPVCPFYDHTETKRYVVVIAHFINTSIQKYTGQQQQSLITSLLQQPDSVFFSNEASHLVVSSDSILFITKKPHNMPQPCPPN